MNAMVKAPFLEAIHTSKHYLQVRKHYLQVRKHYLQVHYFENRLANLSQILFVFYFLFFLTQSNHKFKWKGIESI